MTTKETLHCDNDFFIALRCTTVHRNHSDYVFTCRPIKSVNVEKLETLTFLIISPELVFNFNRDF